MPKPRSTGGSDRAHWPIVITVKMHPKQANAMASSLLGPSWFPSSVVFAGQRRGNYRNCHVSPTAAISPSMTASHSCSPYNAVNDKPAIPFPITDPLSRCHSSSRDGDPCVVPPTTTGCRKTLQRSSPVDMLTDPLPSTSPSGISLGPMIL